MQTLKILAALLTYPGRDLAGAAPEFLPVLRKEGWLPEKSVKGIEKLVSWMQMSDLLDVQEEYVAMFDRTPSLSLHLFEHIHGDSRDRGQALVDLSEIYREEGLEISIDETPDYLPLFLEYLSLLEPEKARENLGEAINVIAAVGARLNQRGSLYAAVFDAIEAAANAKPDQKAVAKAVKDDPGAPMSREEMDAAWEEQFALASLNENDTGGCPKVQDMISRMEENFDKEVRS